MGRTQPDGAVPTKRLRILEVGNHGLFYHAAPDQTDYFYAGHRHSNHRPLGPIQYFRVLQRLRRGEYDLVDLHAARFAPWHPRTFLPILRARRRTRSDLSRTPSQRIPR